MTEKEVLALIEKAKASLENSFVPCTGVAVGACALTDKNILFGGCAVENAVQSSSVGAATVAVLKAVSEGHMGIKAVCIYRFGNILPYLSGAEREIIVQFGKSAIVILANDDTYEKFHVLDLMPYSKQTEEE